jgi:hypothetical protein
MALVDANPGLFRGPESRIVGCPRCGQVARTTMHYPLRVRLCAACWPLANEWVRRHSMRCHDCNEDTPLENLAYSHRTGRWLCEECETTFFDRCAEDSAHYAYGGE